MEVDLAPGDEGRGRQAGARDGGGHVWLGDAGESVEGAGVVFS